MAGLLQWRLTWAADSKWASELGCCLWPPGESLSPLCNSTMSACSLLLCTSSCPMCKCRVPQETRGRCTSNHHTTVHHEGRMAWRVAQPKFRSWPLSRHCDQREDEVTLKLPVRERKMSISDTTLPMSATLRISMHGCWAPMGSQSAVNTRAPESRRVEAQPIVTSVSCMMPSLSA